MRSSAPSSQFDSPSTEISTAIDAGQERRQLEGVEDERHRLAEQVADEDEHGGDEERDLQAGADGDAQAEVHLVLVRDLDRDQVLGDVADQRHQHDADEERGQAPGFGGRLERADQDLAHEDDRDRGGGQDADRHRQPHRRAPPRLRPPCSGCGRLLSAG